MPTRILLALTLLLSACAAKPAPKPAPKPADAPSTAAPHHHDDHTTHDHAAPHTIPAPPAPPADPPPPASRLLSVGDPAPSIAGVTWIRPGPQPGIPHDPVTAFEPGTIYVLDFWATWCGPCIELFPHSSDLQDRFAKDKVRFIAISLWETTRPLGNNDSYAQRVKAFAEKHKDTMRFDVAYEGDNAAMAAAYMRAANRVSIPSVFIVGRDGKIAWIGHPSFDLERVLTAMIAGTFDPAGEEQVIRSREQRRLQGMKLASQLQQRVHEGKFEEAVSMCDEILALDPERAMFAPTAIAKFRVLLTGVKDPTRAGEYARQAVKDYPRSPTVPIGIAGTILLADGAPERSVPLANEMMDLAEGKAAQAPQTAIGPAAMYAAIGRLEALIPMATEPTRSQLQADLATYRSTHPSALIPPPAPQESQPK